jgi:hypothetical protein
VIVITAFGDADTHTAAKRLGAVEVFDKPFDLDDLIAAAKNTILNTGLLARPPDARTANEDVAVCFPCEIVLRHEAAKEPLKNLVLSLAGKLNRFSGLIERCTVVIEKSIAGGKTAPRYHVDVKLVTRNSTIIARGGTVDCNGHSSLCGAITSAFHAVTDHLKHELSREREQSRKGARPQRGR